MNPQNPYPSISRFLAEHKLTQNKREPFRLSDYALGHIHGLPLSFGRRVASNGIICLILTSNGTVYEGHDGWFVRERSDGPAGGNNFNRKKSALDELIASI